MTALQQQVVRELSRLRMRQFAADSLRLRRREIETDAIRLVGEPPDTAAMVVCARLRGQEEALRATVAHTERMLDALPLPQNTVLRAMYVDEREGAIEWLQAQLHISRSQLYRVRDRALARLAEGMCVTDN